MSLELKDKAVLKQSYLKILNTFKCVYYYIQEIYIKIYYLCLTYEDTCTAAGAAIVLSWLTMKLKIQILISTPPDALDYYVL